jgi:YfiH family protein
MISKDMRVIRFKNLEKYNLTAFFTTKDSNFKLDFSLALHTGQDKNIILQNRKILKESLKKEFKFITLSQIHSSKVYEVKEKKEIGWTQISPIEADGLITNLKGIVLGILTADCVPIVLFDPKNRAIANIHSGWRGTKANIIKNTISKMQKNYNTSPKDLIVAFGASIRSCCYEVGKDLAKEFQIYPNATFKREDRYFLDVATVCKIQLLNLGVKEENIEIYPECTSCCSDEFFSYRKEKTPGRFISVIVLNDD